ncbi:hypothetical protein MAPG_00213 [Magnaporthiopsis poae ATCC 64411]|uniref:Uncharacterized protein n=1 Tax=Magnaporthiopsis poae (strain ATCC 64411 / 73-15) TaxID=644358 RepID=A0A0C4DKE4_MAGP6|nr:hypothetical protein MAPG_00213 [Magnaporthiopsis poae ATCC 64411]
MNTPFPANYAQPYFDNLQMANMEGHASGTTPGMDGFEARQLPLLQVRTQWPSYSLGGDHSAASGSAGVGASGSEFGFADPASWSNTPHPQSDSPLLHNTTLTTGYTNLAGAGGAFAMEQYSTLDLSVPPQQLAPEDLDSAHRTAVTTPYETTPMFMTPEQEKEVEKAVGSRSEEECWWDIFRVLIDGETDLATLQSRYSAYYVPNTTRDLGLLTQPQAMLPPPPQQFGHPSSHHHQFDMSGLMDHQQFMLADAQFELQSTSQDTITLRHGGGGEVAGVAAAQVYSGVDPSQHQHQQQVSAAVDARTHLGRIRELVFMGLDDQASAHESLAQIRAILPALEQSIR